MMKISPIAGVAVAVLGTIMIALTIYLLYGY